MNEKLAFVLGFAADDMIKEAPARSRAQQRFMGAELARARRGEKTQTGMSIKQLHDFAATKHKGLPEHVPQEKAAAPTRNSAIPAAAMEHRHAPASPAPHRRHSKPFEGMPPRFFESIGGRNSMETTERGTACVE